MIKKFRKRRADRWTAEARVYRDAAAGLKATHDKHVANGGMVSLDAFSAYATAIGKAEDCERHADRWRP